MARVVFDIETLGYPLETFDPEQQEYLLRFAKTDEERIDTIQKLSLHACTAQVIAIGMLNPETGSGKVFYQAPNKEKFTSDDKKIEFFSGDERFVLKSFWDDIQHFQQFITFNGRTFDGPFLMLRSAIVGIQPTKNLVPYRYSTEKHCDLLEQMTFYGAVRKFNLDFYCKAFGIKSPKSNGITGLELGKLWNEGKYREIAAYCAGDLIATAELFKRWNEFLNIKE
jgi:DNA polymerase elongation subunit (family B)